MPSIGQLLHVGLLYQRYISNFLSRFTLSYDPIPGLHCTVHYNYLQTGNAGYC